MNKRSFNKVTRIIVTCTILVSLLCGYALADVIFEPEDDFYKTHANECQYVNRDYYANGETGYLEMFTKPDGTSLGFADNGGVFHVQFNYKLGDELWGVIEYSEKDGKLFPRGEQEYKTGWIKMNDTIVKYDYISFDEKHSSEYTSYDGDYSEFSAVSGMAMWTFPCSGENNGIVEGTDENFVIESVYTDSEGRKWGFVSYYYAMKNFWICISDPTNMEIAALDVETPALYSPEPGQNPKSSTNDTSTVIIVCVAATMLATAVVLAAMKKRKLRTRKKIIIKTRGRPSAFCGFSMLCQLPVN